MFFFGFSLGLHYLCTAKIKKKMMTLYPKLIMDALATVTYAGTKKNLVESGMVADTPAINGMKVKIVLLFPRDTDPFLKSTVKAAEAAIHYHVSKDVEVEIVTEFQSKPRPEVEKLLPQGTLAFVGDGINDAPVLTRADVGIAMGALGSDAAIEAADVVLMDDKPSKIASAIRIARRTLAIARQNIVFAIGIKVLVLVLATLGLATMWMAVFADVGVTVLAVLNAMRALRS